MDICHLPLRWRIIDGDRDVNCFPSCCRPWGWVGWCREKKTEKKLHSCIPFSKSLMSSYCSGNLNQKRYNDYRGLIENWRQNVQHWSNTGSRQRCKRLRKLSMVALLIYMQVCAHVKILHICNGIITVLPRRLQNRAFPEMTDKANRIMLPLIPSFTVTPPPPTPTWQCHTAPLYGRLKTSSAVILCKYC